MSDLLEERRRLDMDACSEPLWALRLCPSKQSHRPAGVRLAQRATAGSGGRGTSRKPQTEAPPALSNSRASPSTSAPRVGTALGSGKPPAGWPPGALQTLGGPNSLLH